MKDKRIGAFIEYDEGKLGDTGHEAHDHYHRLNPETKGNQDLYLDAKGNPVPKDSEASHLYPSKWIWWE